MLIKRKILCNSMFFQISNQLYVLRDGTVIIKDLLPHILKLLWPSSCYMKNEMALHFTMTHSIKQSTEQDIFNYKSSHDNCIKICCHSVDFQIFI